MAAPCWRRCSIALALVIGAPTGRAAHHDNPAAYADVVDAYVQGRFKEAAARLLEWQQTLLAKAAHDFAATASLSCGTIRTRRTL
jgi:hypothetical protein